MTQYEHQPDFPTARIVARPQNDQPEASSVILAAKCVCGDSNGWSVTVPAATWTQTPVHILAQRMRSEGRCPECRHLWTEHTPDYGCEECNCEEWLHRAGMIDRSENEDYNERG